MPGLWCPGVSSLLGVSTKVIQHFNIWRETYAPALIKPRSSASLINNFFGMPRSSVQGKLLSRYLLYCQTYFELFMWASHHLSVQLCNLENHKLKPLKRRNNKLWKLWRNPQEKKLISQSDLFKLCWQTKAWVNRWVCNPEYQQTLLY